MSAYDFVTGRSDRCSAPFRGSVRYLYLVRHGNPEFSDGVRRCIGRTDLPLSERGRRKAAEAGAYFAARYPEPGSLKVYASPLIRARETAEILCAELERGRGDSKDRTVYRAESGLQELFLGEWENLSMEELKRVKTLESQPAQGEPRPEGLARFREAVRRILAESPGDVVCVTHAGIASLFLADLLGLPPETSRALPQPYGGISRIAVSASGKMAAEELGRMPEDMPSDEECQALWEHYGTLPKVREHCRAVCAEAERIAEGLLAGGVGLNLPLIRAAALLHDIARNQVHEAGRDKGAHAAAGADLLLREGYPRMAEIIRCHHDLGSVLGPVDERKVVYLADKRVLGTQRISVEERFAASLERCRQSGDPEAALAARERRLREALLVEKQIRVYAPEI